MPLPSFIWYPFDTYSRSRALDDAYYKYRALESVSATLIKYVGTTFSLIGADQGKFLEEATSGRIFSSSSLGGWVSATDYVCAQSKQLPEQVKSYCSLFSDYRKHPEREILDKLAVSVNRIQALLEERGYRTEEARSLNLCRAMNYLVEFRNKCAHGSLDVPFFASAEPHLFQALQILLSMIPFDVFTLWGRYGNYTVRLRGRPEYIKRRRDAHFWIESQLLEQGFTEKIPFLVYRAEDTRIYCLNDAVRDRGTECEFIDYGTGKVVYREVDYDSMETSSTGDDRILGLQPTKFREHAETLGKKLRWREVPVTQSAIETQGEESGVYLFIASVKVYGRRLDSVLYVGQTRSLKERLRHYVRTKKGYDVTRQEISRMFDKYGPHLKFIFAGTELKELDKTERSLFEVLRPEFNQKSPPDPKEE